MNSKMYAKIEIKIYAYTKLTMINQLNLKRQDPINYGILFVYNFNMVLYSFLLILTLNFIFPNDLYCKSIACTNTKNTIIQIF